MKTKRIAVTLLLLFLLLVPVSAVLAAPPFDSKVVPEGETVPNDVIVLDGDLEVEGGATVSGDVVVFNGNVEVAGTIEGDLVLFNGDLEATETAVIKGDCVLFNGSLEDESASGLGCTAVESNLPNFFAALAEMPNLPRMHELPGRPDINVRVPSPATRFFTNLAEAAGRSLVLGFLAFVAASMLPEHLVQVEEAMRRKPVASGTVGLLTAVAVPSLVALLVPVSIILTFVCIGLLGFPLMLALILGLAAGGLLGWIAVGNMVGERLAGPLKLKNRTLPVTAALGTALLTLVIGLMGFGEGLVTFLVGCIGLGATALTKFGTRSYPEETITNGPKITAVLETLPAEETAELKNSEK